MTVHTGPVKQAKSTSEVALMSWISKMIESLMRISKDRDRLEFRKNRDRWYMTCMDANTPLQVSTIRLTFHPDAYVRAARRCRAASGAYN